MSPSEIDNVGEHAVEVVNAFVAAHHAAAIPALLGACALWAVENGAGDLVRGSLERVAKMSRDMERAHKKEQN